MKKLPPLSRRLLLRGATASLALPWLEAMLPRRSAAQAALAPKRFIAFYVPNGIHMSNWTPDASGSSWNLKPILMPLGAQGSKPSIQADVNVITGLGNEAGRAIDIGDHASGTVAFITAVRAEKTRVRVGISLDQVFANTWRAQTRLASLELGTDASAGYSDNGYPSPYVANISWANETLNLAKLANPTTIFNRISMARGPTTPGPGMTDVAAALARKHRKSVLDAVKADADGLKPKLGLTDQRKLDEYLTGVRELERRVEATPMTTTPPPMTCQNRAAPGPTNGIEQQTQLILDLLVWAMSCDITRSATFMLQNAASGHSFSLVDGANRFDTGNHHSLSHHGGISSRLETLTRIGAWEVEQFAYLVRAMKAVAEPNGTTLLHNSMVFFSSEISDGDRHDHDNLPVLLAGNAGGRVTTGRHLRFTNRAPIANLFLSIADAVGVPQTRFGSFSTGLLPGLL